MEIINGGYGNPSAGHIAGRKAAKKLVEARSGVAELLGVSADTVFFTSGGTEANALAFFGIVKRPGMHVITSTAEHPSVLSCCKALEGAGVAVSYIKPRQNGYICPDDLARNITGDTAFVSLMHVNHETGVISDIQALSKAVKNVRKDIVFHVDAVQGFGKHDLHKLAGEVDMVTVSSHKIHGIGGCGALYVRRELQGRLRPMLYGGGQEGRLRSGTENLAGICAFGEAAREASEGLEQNLRHVQIIRNILVEVPSIIPCAVINGENTSPYVVNISFPGINAEVMQNALDERGVCVSPGAACSTGSKKRAAENVVYAYGLGVARAESSVRFSASRYSTEHEAREVIMVLEEIYKKVQR